MKLINGVQHGEPYFLVSGAESLFQPITGESVERVRTAVSEKIGTFFPDNPVLWIDLEEVHERLHDQVMSAKGKYGYLPVVSLSSLYYPHADAFIECNRVVDHQGNPLGVGPRPGSDSIGAQVDHIRRALHDSSVIVADDTLFHGDSLSDIMKKGLKVKAVVECFATDEAKNRLEKKGVAVYCSSPLEGFLDMLPLHDFLPPLQLCGKVIGRIEDEPMPILTNGLSLSLPYLLPYITVGQLKSWASIPRRFAEEFSKLCLEEAVQMFTVLEPHGISHWNDITSLYPRASYPHRTRGKDPNPESRIVDLLKEDLQHLNQGGS